MNGFGSGPSANSRIDFRRRSGCRLRLGLISTSNPRDGGSPQPAPGVKVEATASHPVIARLQPPKRSLSIS